MNFGARLVDDNDCKAGVLDGVLVAKSPCQLFAMLDRACGGRKLQPTPVPDWNPILHVKIESPHACSLFAGKE
jgi:hypothetical protein